MASAASITSASCPWSLSANIQLSFSHSCFCHLCRRDGSAATSVNDSLVMKKIKSRQENTTQEKSFG
jgi:hypothetical protein